MNNVTHFLVQCGKIRPYKDTRAEFGTLGASTTSRVVITLVQTHAFKQHIIGNFKFCSGRTGVTGMRKLVVLLLYKAIS